jgi:hypothetical protein
MRRAAVIVILAGLSLGACEGGQPAQPSQGASAGGEQRMRRARREMGLGEALGADEDGDDDEEESDRPFAIGPDHVPEMPDGVDPEGERLGTGLARAADTLALTLPPPSETLDVPSFQRWVENDYAAWLRARGEALRSARTELAAAEDGEVGEYVVASAVIGLLFARFAQAIGTITLPRSIAEDDGERLRFRDAFLRTSAPLWDRAADAFGACASATVRSGDASLGEWQRFCDELAELAQEAPRPIE